MRRQRQAGRRWPQERPGAGVADAAVPAPAVHVADRSRAFGQRLSERLPVPQPGSAGRLLPAAAAGAAGLLPAAASARDGASRSGLDARTYLVERWGLLAGAG